MCVCVCVCVCVCSFVCLFVCGFVVVVVGFFGFFLCVCVFSIHLQNVINLFYSLTLLLYFYSHHSFLLLLSDVTH